MSEVLIKNMKLPKSCSECPCSSGEVDFCNLMQEMIEGQYFNPFMNRRGDCPMVAMPEHDNLVSEKDVIEKVLSKTPEELGTSLCFLFATCPVILESNRSKERKDDRA